MDLGLDLRDVVTSDISYNPSLRNETKTLFRETRVECGIIAHNNTQRKVKTNEVNITVENISTEERRNDLG